MTKKGKAWMEPWNGMMSRCVGFERSALRQKGSLPCLPSTVVYGHTASRGLDVHRWTMGLDTGCVCCASTSLVSCLRIPFQVYGRKLMALVLDGPHPHGEAASRGVYESHDSRYDDEDEDDDDVRAKSGPGTLLFGDSKQARLFSVHCHKRREERHNGP